MGKPWGRGHLRLPRPRVPPAPRELTAMTKTSTAARTIVAVDLGKYKSTACTYATGTAAASFTSFTTCRDRLARLFKDARPDVVVIETCALSGWVHDLCGELGLACRVANTASEAWKFKHTKRKTDRDDALRLAELQALGQLPAVAVPDKPTREWRALKIGRAHV